jgi:hypothetical protein
MKVAERSKIEVISSTGHQAKVIIPGQVVEPSPKIPPLDERLLKPAPYTSTATAKCDRIARKEKTSAHSFIDRLIGLSFNRGGFGRPFCAGSS